jgi:hypothetical protein
MMSGRASKEGTAVTGAATPVRGLLLLLQRLL